MTSAMIDSRDFLAAKRRAETEVLMPAGPKIAFSGGDSADHKLIWAKLDQIRAKHPDMVLMHGGSAPKAPKRSPRAGPTHARFRRSPSSPTGPSTPRPRPSSATTRCWPSCRSASSSSPARAFRTISPTRPASWAFRYIGSAKAARERRQLLSRVNQDHCLGEPTHVKIL